MSHSALRRVVPPGYRVFELALTGISPLLMSSADADRESDTYVAYRKLSKKRAKTPEDEKRLRELEWYTRLYWDEDPEIGAFIPGRNVKEMLRSAATDIRKGESVIRSLVVPEFRVPLLYQPDGFEEPADLWEAGFAYTTMVANAGAGSGRVERTRPCFDEWSLICEVAIDPEELSDDDLAHAVDRSQKYGLGDFRRGDFGAFVTNLEYQREQRAGTNASGIKPRDVRMQTALAARKKIMQILEDED